MLKIFRNLKKLDISQNQYDQSNKIQKINLPQLESLTVRDLASFLMFTGLVSLKHIQIFKYESYKIDLDGIFDPSKIFKLEIQWIKIYDNEIDEVLRLFTNLRSLHLSDDLLKYEQFPTIKALTSLSFGTFPSLESF